MDNQSIQHIETGNNKILYSIQYTNDSSINESQNVNIVTYEALEIPDVITVRSCEYFNTVIQEPDVSDILFEQNNDDNETTVVFNPESLELNPNHLNTANDNPNISELLFEENDNANDIEVILEPPKKKRLKQPKATPKGERKPRGRRLKVPNQTRAQRKKNVNTNKTYVNSKGEEVKPKEFDTEFRCTCPKKCTDNKNLPLKTRMQIFNMFWGVGTFEGRCAFIHSCVNEVPKKRCYTKNKDNQKRKNTRKYYLKGVEVCKVTFIKTLMISSSRVDSSLAKTDNEVFVDNRGRNKSTIAFSTEKKQLVIDHIQDSYCPEESLRGMWAHYMETFPEDPVSESFYKRIFYENYKLKFNKVKIKCAVKKGKDCSDDQ